MEHLLANRPSDLSRHRIKSHGSENGFNVNADVNRM